MKRFIIALVIVGALIQGVCAGSYADFVKQVKPYTEEYHAISRGVTNVIRSGNVPDLQDMQRRIDGLIRMYNAAPLQHQEWMKALNIDITSLVGFLVSIQDLIARKEGLAEQQLVIARDGQHVAERQLAALQTNYDRALVRIADGRENVGQAVLEKYHGANPAEKARLERDVAEANQLVVAGAELVLAQDGEKKEEDVFKAAGQIGQAQQMNEALMEGKTQDIHKLQREVAEVVQERDQAKEEVVGIGEQLDEAEVEVRKLKRQLAQTEEKARNAKSEEERVRLAEQAEREKEAVKKAQETAQDYSEKIQHRQARRNELE